MIETVERAFRLYVLHLDTARQIIAAYGMWTYLILFAVIFCETGLVVTPFLPGDSLLFRRRDDGQGVPPQHPRWRVLAAAAIVGDNVNYWIGRYIGPRAFSGKVRFLKKEYLDRTHRFFEKYGPQGDRAGALRANRPHLRAFCGRCRSDELRKFLRFDIPGGLAWVGMFLIGGTGLVAFVPENHFHLVILAIVFISVLPMIVEAIRARSKSPPLTASDRGSPRLPPSHLPWSNTTCCLCFATAALLPKYRD